MIAKSINGKGFHGALEYNLKKEHGRIIRINMDGRGPGESPAEFGEIRKLRPNLRKSVLSVLIAACQTRIRKEDRVGRRQLRKARAGWRRLPSNQRWVDEQ